MSEYIVVIDKLLAAALRGEKAADHQLLTVQGRASAIVERINYHGIAGLLRNLPGAMTGWPDAITKHVSDCAIAQTMWELRHRQIVNDLLGALAAAKVVAFLLKGTALAYDLYPAPAARKRGDSDFLVDPSDLAATRLILQRHGFERIRGDGRDDEFCLQEVWTRTCNRDMAHHVDLHWQLLNTPALATVFPVAECAASLVSLPRLGPDAMVMNRVLTLIHTCIHRMLSFTSPYFVGERTYYGGDRLIWLNDIDLLARSLSDAEWDTFVRLSIGKGVASACLDGLLTTQRVLATPVPAVVCGSLGTAPTTSRPSAYLRARQLGRAWQDLRAMPGVRKKYGYLLARTLPSAEFVRAKYPGHTRLPLPLLYARRLCDLFRARPAQSAKR